jgi:hypothetical protein
VALDQVTALIADADRLLAAGAKSAAGDEALRRRAAALRDIARQVTALAPVADAVDRVVSAPPKVAAAALLDLLSLTRQLRARLVAAGVSGTVENLPPSGPWKTDTPTPALRTLHDALGSSNYGREFVVRKAVEDGTAFDLRLLDPLLALLRAQDNDVAESAAKEALPGFGRAVLPELLAGFKMKGKAADGYRLRAVGRIDPAEAVRLARAAVAEGSTPVQVAALECLAEFDPTAAEAAALPLAARGPVELRVAAIGALGKSSSDAALEAVLAARHEDDFWLRNAAQEALEKLPHPDAVGRLRAELAAGLAELSAPLPKPAKGKNSPEAVKERRRQWVALLLTVLGNRKDNAPALPDVLPLLRHGAAEVRDAAFEAVVHFDQPDRVVPALVDTDSPARAAAGDGVAPAETPLVDDNNRRRGGGRPAGAGGTAATAGADQLQGAAVLRHDGVRPDRPGRHRRPAAADRAAVGPEPDDPPRGGRVAGGVRHPGAGGPAQDARVAGGREEGQRARVLDRLDRVGGGTGGLRRGLSRRVRATHRLVPVRCTHPTGRPLTAPG